MYAVVIIYILFMILTLHAAHINNKKGNPQLAMGSFVQAGLFLAMIIITWKESTDA
jgi:hypothetical protein